MTVPDLLFYVFSLLALVCGLLVVANPWSRNAVTSAMFLVLTIVSLAGLFVLLHAYFLAAVQILVYAGAVMVLFLFVIMLLDLKEESRRRVRKVWLVCGLGASGAIAAVLMAAAWHVPARGGSRVPEIEGTTAPLGEMLFKSYLLPFEILSVLLLVAIVGTILLSKKEAK